MILENQEPRFGLDHQKLTDLSGKNGDPNQQQFSDHDPK
jgi:hypothetical protein